MSYYKSFSDINQKKIEIYDILDRGKLSIYHAGVLIKEIGEMFTNMPYSIIQDFEEVKKEAETMLEKMVEKAMSMAKKHSEIMDTIEGMFIEQEQVWARCMKNRKEWQDRIDNIPTFKVPSVYGLEQLYDIATKLDNLDDNQWTKVRELAESLSK